MLTRDKPLKLNVFLFQSTNFPDWLIHWVVVLRPTPHKVGHLETFPQASLSIWYGKI